MHFESLELRRMFAGEPGVLADLQVDANRDGRIDALDYLNEDQWTPARGTIILPNLDRDNTTTGAPDNWSGGNFNGSPAAPNNIIDNAADLADIGIIRLANPPNPILTPFSVNHINSLLDGPTVITGKAFGPKVAWRDGVKRDLFQDYVISTFKGAGYSAVHVVDSTTYHNSGGNIHCGTNVVREIPTAVWWV